MHLKRVRVPNFKVLKDIDISFESDLVPQIFPIGSINGGGKSTLLQLIFTLLHCPGKYNRIPYLQNMLDCFILDDDSRHQDLANIEIIIDEQTVELDFFICDREYIINEVHVTDDNNVTIELEPDIKVSNLINLHSSLTSRPDFFLGIVSRVEVLMENIASKKNALENPDFDDSFEMFMNGHGTAKFSEKEIKSIEYFVPDKRIRDFSLELDKLNINSDKSKDIAIELLNNISSIVLNQKLDLLKNSRKNLRFQAVLDENHSLGSITFFICHCNESRQDRELFLMCNVKNLALGNILSRFADQIFLAAPVTQVFHFLDSADRLFLFRAEEDGVTYHSRIDTAKSSLKGFFPYDFLAVDLLLQIFIDARNDDFKQAISTGEYGGAYQRVVADLVQILGDKKANLDLDLGGINFTKIDESGNQVKLYPSDFSHGELKRLSLYVWLKYNNINDAIVLMDEVEIALHPDWQYGIINDLQTWAPTNQYIIATHSYELCQALTPAHVKEIEPKLLKQQK
jgi:ABC-type dipeptide/oligopeptide/nickel transport system ATPase component